MILVSLLSVTFLSTACFSCTIKVGDGICNHINVQRIQDGRIYPGESRRIDIAKDSFSVDAGSYTVQIEEQSRKSLPEWITYKPGDCFLTVNPPHTNHTMLRITLIASCVPSSASLSKNTTTELTIRFPKGNNRYSTNLTKACCMDRTDNDTKLPNLCCMSSTNQSNSCCMSRTDQSNLCCIDMPTDSNNSCCVTLMTESNYSCCVTLVTESNNSCCVTSVTESNNSCCVVIVTDSNNSCCVTLVSESNNSRCDIITDSNNTCCNNNTNIAQSSNSCCIPNMVSDSERNSCCVNTPSSKPCCMIAQSSESTTQYCLTINYTYCCIPSSLRSNSSIISSHDFQSSNIRIAESTYFASDTLISLTSFSVTESNNFASSNVIFTDTTIFSTDSYTLTNAYRSSDILLESDGNYFTSSSSTDFVIDDFKVTEISPIITSTLSTSTNFVKDDFKETEISRINTSPIHSYSLIPSIISTTKPAILSMIKSDLDLSVYYSDISVLETNQHNLITSHLNSSSQVSTLNPITPSIPQESIATSQASKPNVFGHFTSSIHQESIATSQASTPNVFENFTSIIHQDSIASTNTFDQITQQSTFINQASNAFNHTTQSIPQESISARQSSTLSDHVISSIPQETIATSGASSQIHHQNHSALSYQNIVSPSSVETDLTHNHRNPSVTLRNDSVLKSRIQPHNLSTLHQRSTLLSISPSTISVLRSNVLSKESQPTSILQPHTRDFNILTVSSQLSTKQLNTKTTINPRTIVSSVTFPSMTLKSMTNTSMPLFSESRPSVVSVSPKVYSSMAYKSMTFSSMTILDPISPSMTSSSIISPSMTFSSMANPDRISPSMIFVSMTSTSISTPNMTVPNMMLQTTPSESIFPSIVHDQSINQPSSVHVTPSLVVLTVVPKIATISAPCQSIETNTICDGTLAAVSSCKLTGELKSMNRLNVGEYAVLHIPTSFLNFSTELSLRIKNGSKIGLKIGEEFWMWLPNKNRREIAAFPCIVDYRRRDFIFVLSGVDSNGVKLENEFVVRLDNSESVGFSHYITVFINASYDGFIKRKSHFLFEFFEKLSAFSNYTIKVSDVVVTKVDPGSVVIQFHLKHPPKDVCDLDQVNNIYSLFRTNNITLNPKLLSHMKPDFTITNASLHLDGICTDDTPRLTYIFTYKIAQILIPIVVLLIILVIVCIIVIIICHKKANEKPDTEITYTRKKAYRKPIILPDDFKMCEVVDYKGKKPIILIGEHGLTQPVDSAPDVERPAPPDYHSMRWSHDLTGNDSFGVRAPMAEDDDLPSYRSLPPYTHNSAVFTEL